MHTLQRLTKKAFLFAVLHLSVYVSLCKAQGVSGVFDNQLMLSNETYSISFQWQGDSLHGAWEPYAALLLPVAIPNCPEQFYMQFDLGAPYSLFYKNKLMAIQARYPLAMLPTDTAATLKDISFKVGKMPVLAKEIVVRQFDSSKIDWTNREKKEIIGTIGADLIENKVVLIDYVQQKLLIGAALPSRITEKFTLSNFVFAGRSVLLPAMIRGEQTLLYFDTGSSAFELLADKRTSEMLALPNTAPLQYKVKSWDRVLTANTFLTSDSVDIGFQRLPICRVTYIEDASTSQIEQMKKMGIGGMVGNKLFLNSLLFLDTKNKKFGVLNYRQAKVQKKG